MGSLAVGTAFCSLSFVAQFGPTLVRWREQRSLRAAVRRTRTLILTFDDGPGPTLTPEILGLLGAYRVPATFFLLGQHVPGNEELLDRVKHDGHELGCHGYRHCDAWKTWPWKAVADIQDGYRALQPWVSPRGIFRPPGGKLSGWTYILLRRRRVPLGWWTIDSGDTHAALPPPETLVTAVQRDGGGVVLLHDFDRDDRTRAQRHAFVLTATEMLLKYARAEGLQVLRLGQALAVK